MNPDKTIEYNSLSWVKAQLDDVLSDAQSNLNDYIESKADEDLENCIEHLQLIYGTLQMVEVYGASMLADEMQYTATALLEGKVESAYDAYDVLMRAMLQLPDYLESIQAGKTDAPITLMPLINDLRAARNEGLLSEGVLFSPDIENTKLVSSEYDVDTIESGKLQDEVKRLRTHYQIGLLDFIRNNKELVGLKRIKAVLKSLEKVTSNTEVRHMWMIVGALVEGLIDESIENNLTVKMLLGAIDRQLKLVLDVGENEFSEQYSKELVTNILYYVGLSTGESGTVLAVKDAYNLADLLPQESDAAGAMIGGLNADLFDTVSKGITEDLALVKDVLELFMHSNDQNTEQLVPVAEQLGKIGDTYGMLGMGATRQAIMDQRVVLESIISGDVEVGEQVVLGIASGLLKAESELKDFIAERSGFVDMNRSSEDQTVPASEYRQVVFTVVSEGLKNFSEAKEAILSYVSGAGDNEQLDIILNRLEEVRGVAMMLPLGRVESQIERLQNFIRIALLNNDHQATTEEQDTVADVVTSIEYFLEALSEGRPGVEQGLNAGDTAAEKLDDITRSYGGAEPDVAVEDGIPLDVEQAEGDQQETKLADVETLEMDTTTEPVRSDSVTFEASSSEPELSESGAPAEDVSQYIILADDADEEIVEIFIEEAIEVLGELHEHMPQWIENANNTDSLAVVRRCFHTLKGSGRLLGAEMIGEFSWKFENVLNRIIDEKINVSDALYQALDEALAVIPQLIEQLKGNREPIDNIAQLMSVADALAEGREVSLNAAEAKVETGNSETDDTEIDSTVLDGAELDDIEEIEIDHAEVSLEINDAVDIVSFEDIRDDLSIGDSSDLDISELDPDNNVSLEAIDRSARKVPNEPDTGVQALQDDGESDAEVVEISESDEEVIVLDSEALAEDDFDIELENIEKEAGEASSESEVSEQETEGNISDEGYEVVIDEDDEVVKVSADALSLDPMLLKIYHDESLAHIENIRQRFAECESENLPLKADKDLIRAFHTLYGSARTAEVEPIADLTGTTEKYILARQDSGKEIIPDDVAIVLRKIEQSVSTMLETVAKGTLPTVDGPLHEKINKIFQQEIQVQLQQSWQDSSPATEESLSVDESELSTADEPPVEDMYTEDLDVINFDDIEAEESEPEPEISEETETSVVTEEPHSAVETVEMSYGDIDDELIDIFLEEADELLESCEEILGKIKDEPNSTEHIHKLQRNMHTLKGGARMADLTGVGDLTHNLESLVVMVNDKKVYVDKAWLDLFQESLDTLTTMLTAVKKREPMVSAGDLNERVEMMMRGEVKDKRSVERFDIELSELESSDDEDFDEIDIANMLLDEKDDGSEQQRSGDITKRSNEDNREERPHWGERATDVNFKDSQEQVRVRSDLLNNLVDYAGEVNIYHARMGKQISDFSFNLSELTQTVVRLKEQLRNLEIETEIQIRSGYEKESDSFDDNFDPLEMDQYSTLQQLTRSLSETAGDVDSLNEILTDITRDSETLLVQESRISTDLQEGLMRTRMVRFGGLSSRLRRIVRQVARELGKEVEVVINGEGSEVDRTVLDRIIAPLEHMLRNAVAHGIEAPEERKSLGKNEVGKIIIDVDRQGADVVIKVKDDGAGIDTHKIRQKAVKLGLLSAADVISDHDALQFILHSGFSTADEVTQVAGRGVGMDVVDSEIKQLGGILDIDTTHGKGTEFNIRLPLTLAINQALLVSAADDVFAVPLASIEGVVRITGLELQSFYDSENSHYEFNGVEYELKHLGNLLTGHQMNYAKQLQLFPVLLVHVGDQHFALHVEDLIGRREIVVKPVGMQIGSVHGIAGATILADGRVVLILEMSALVVADSLFRAHAPVTEEVPEAVVDDVKTIMVVDDSITIRKITERMLKRYGINVILAKDGVDATNQLQEYMPDLMLLDIEMPRMDGFEVASYVRNDERLKGLPIIMITSRTGNKHKEKAMEIGVDQYLGKPFQEEDLMNNINKILNTSL